MMAVFLLLFSSLLAFSGIAAADQSDFKSLCYALMSDSGNVTACDQLHGMFFKDGNTREFAAIRPEQVQAPQMPVDSRIQFYVFNDPNYLPAMSYCYFVYRKWIEPSRNSPDQLGLGTSGFAILNEELGAYQRWLESDRAGKQCKSKVKAESGVTVANLEASLGKSIALIAVNPLAIVKDKGSDIKVVLREMANTINHERVHAYQVLCPEFAKWSKAQWEVLPDAEKKSFMARNPQYNWKDPKVTSREYVGFLLENKPEQLARLVQGCRS